MQAECSLVGGGDGGGGVYANRRERGVLFKANKLKQDIKKCVAVYSVAAAYYVRLSLQKFSYFCVVYDRFLLLRDYTQAARGTNIINSSRLSHGGADLIHICIYIHNIYPNISSYGGGDLTSEHRFSRHVIIIFGVFVGNF
jgi:hypothetical protein